MALDLLLPPRCVLCGLPSGTLCLCEACAAELPWNGACCRQCGLPLPTAQSRLCESLVCGFCLQKPPLFTRTVSPLRYCFPADRLVQALKFNGQLVAGRILGQLLCEYVDRHGLTLPDALIPVPLHPLRLIRRGYNQAYELARHASRELAVPLFADSLRRSRNTPAQSGLSRKQRRKNVRGAFYWRGRITPGRHVVIVDDVMTTGTTVTECARIVKKAGAKRVDVWVAARAITSR